ncbi:MAG: hypothetical protein A2X64_02890 [Ignavibacteria bacterium GWF2_33_9]|nr:MAG: hypothetical protein A2X64_02890 [Ignavibacteria bacterium GWF2_33_9]
MNLKEDLKNILIHELTQLGENVSKSSNIKELVRLHINLLTKLIHPQPRKIHKSKIFLTKEQILHEPFKKALQDICYKLEIGIDVNGHLSKQSTNPSYNDLLLNDWAIHHLHISNKKKNTNQLFYDRSDWLFFVLLKPKDIYLLDIYRHGDQFVFSKQDLLKQIKHNWPEILKPFEATGFEGVTKTFNDEDISRLRKVGINVVNVIDDIAIFPIGGGLSTAGTNINHTMEVNRMLLILENIEQQLHEKKSFVEKELKKYKVNKKDDIDFELYVNDQGGFAIREKKTKININFIIKC